jgi:hypothetical protein
MDLNRLFPPRKQGEGLRSEKVTAGGDELRSEKVTALVAG